MQYHSQRLRPRIVKSYYNSNGKSSINISNAEKEHEQIQYTFSKDLFFTSLFFIIMPIGIYKIAKHITLKTTPSILVSDAISDQI